MVSSEEFRKLAPQFRCPSGPIGEQVGKQMDELNASQNNWVLSLLNFQSSDRVLEIGFGTGKTLGKVSKIIKEGKIYGIELSDTMINVASKKFKNEISHGLIEFHKGNSESLPFPDNLFNKIFSVHTVYFWKSLNKVFSQLFRVSKIGGITAIYFVSPILAPTEVFHEYNQAEIVQELTIVGYKDIQIQKKKFGEQNGVCILAKK